MEPDFGSAGVSSDISVQEEASTFAFYQTNINGDILSQEEASIAAAYDADVNGDITAQEAASSYAKMSITYGQETEVGNAPQNSSLNVIRFPENIGTQAPLSSTFPVGSTTSGYATVGTGHYMMIFANVQRRTQYPYTPDTSSRPTIVENANRIYGSSDATFDINYLISNINNTVRTTEAFVLQIPDTVNYANQQVYDEFGIGGTYAGAAITGAASFQDLMRSKNKDITSGMARNAAPAFLAVASKNLPGVNGGGQAIFQNVTGLAINPMMEVIYSKPSFREFRFDFLLYPRSKSEGESLQKLIRRLRFHHSPEIYKQSKGFFLVPPSTFDIKFFYNGQENKNIDPISTCVLQTIEVDYAPQGWSAYEELNNQNVSLGGTGMPVGIRLGLQFRETEYMTKEHYTGTGE